jgi:hypothetical protein
MEVFVGMIVLLALFGAASVLWGADSRPGFDGNFDDGRGNLPPFRKAKG